MPLRRTESRDRIGRLIVVQYHSPRKGLWTTESQLAREMGQNPGTISVEARRGKLRSITRSALIQYFRVDGTPGRMVRQRVRLVDVSRVN